MLMKIQNYYLIGITQTNKKIRLILTILGNFYLKHRIEENVILGIYLTFC
jgi:hypothetical protein